MHVYRREKYLAHIRSFYHDEGLIKVIAGVRHLSLMEFIAGGGDLVGTE